MIRKGGGGERPLDVCGGGVEVSRISFLQNQDQRWEEVICSRERCAASLLAACGEDLNRAQE
jgi:hypothetical protein